MRWCVRLARWLVGDEYVIESHENKVDTISAAYAMCYADGKSDLSLFSVEMRRQSKVKETYH